MGRVLVAGIGNVLRGDDGFGPAVIRALERDPRLPPDVRCLELGIGGIGLIHELMEGYGALILIDAVDRGGRPGDLYVLAPEVPASALSAETDSQASTGDMHEAGPDRTLVIATALGILPSFVRLIGCQPAATEEFSLELSPGVQDIVPRAVNTVFKILETEIPSFLSDIP